LAPESTPEPTLSVVVVTFRHGEALRGPLEAVAAQLREGDELIVVDNASGDETPAIALEVAPGARLIRNDENTGFPAACNAGAVAAEGDVLVFLNPDAVVAEGWREEIARPASDGSDWAAWQGYVTAEDGQVVNTRGGVLHFTGIAWAGGAGEPVGDGAVAAEPAFASGACLAVPRQRFEWLGGFAPEFFLYHEDVDLSLRVRLKGGTLGVAADARVDHDYQFDKGPAKWRYLERNRWATLLRTYPAPLLALLAPALLATELALIPVSIAGGWFGQKARAWGDTLRSLPRLLRERREIQAQRMTGAAEFARQLTPALDSPYLGAASRSPLLAALLRGYWRVVVRLLGA
jgi:N-acetylglucosaminyl-diphospho-decaprenol L-rhamnosyltransferase